MEDNDNGASMAISGLGDGVHSTALALRRTQVKKKLGGGGGKLITGISQLLRGH